jgi:hypothetical protein
MRDDRTQPADERFEDRIEHQRARAGHEQVQGQPPALPEREEDPPPPR